VGDQLPIEITGPLRLDREIVELVVLVEAPSASEALGEATPIAEEVVEHLSFETHYAVRPFGTRIVDVTEPIAAGEMRDFMQLSGFPLAKYLQSAALGHVEISDHPQLPDAMPELNERVAAARGWYVKSLATPCQADQFIFLWIALEILWAGSSYRTSGPYTCPNGHEVPNCPTCNAPAERPVMGLGIRRFLVEACGVEEDDARKLWRARQIIHGEVSFDSAEIGEMPARVQLLRAAVARQLKIGMGRDADGLPRVAPGAFAIDPSSTGVTGTCPIQDEDLGWP
jgi:hypothetical protein